MPDRFYLDGDLSQPAAELAGDEAHHLIHVLRKKPGGEIVLFDGRGGEARAEILTVARRTVELRIIDFRREPRDDRGGITLATAVPKGDRFRWLVEKATELCVHRLVPLVTERSVVRPGRGRLDKLRQTVIAACKQSGRNRLMEIAPPTPWNELLDHVSVGRPSKADRTALEGRPTRCGCRLLIADSSGEDIASALRRVDEQSDLVLAVGPEGGWTAGELDRAVSSGGVPVCLGPLTLRIETSAVALAAACHLFPAAGVGRV